MIYSVLHEKRFNRKCDIKVALSNFFFCHYVFKKLSAAEAPESAFMRERVNENIMTCVCLD